MPQALTPDVNVAVTRHRECLIRARMEENPPMFNFALQGLLGCLDEELTLEMIPRSQYEVEIAVEKSAVCKECDNEILISGNLDVVRHVDSWYIRSVGRETNKNSVHVVCPKCKHRNAIDVSKDRIIETRTSPVNLKVLPMPPPVFTPVDRIYNNSQYWQWADIVIHVLEDRMRKFREKYQVREMSDVAVEGVIDLAD